MLGNFTRRERFFSHQENRLSHEGDIAAARQRICSDNFSNLTFLLEKRFEWFKQRTKPGESIIEIGSGHGAIKKWLPYVWTSDIKKYDWIDLELDANNMNLEKESVDCFILCHMIHHVAKPLVFLRELHSYLKPGGKVLIQDPHTSLIFRLLLIASRHEGFSYERDVFDDTKTANNPEDPWSANCAILELLFRDKARFERLTSFRITEDGFSEFLTFALSGGVIARAPTIQMGKKLLLTLDRIDDWLIEKRPDIFALSRRVSLIKPK